MKISAVQCRSVAGDVAGNVERHLEFLELSIAHGAELVVFPELSLTGYEPRLARALAGDRDDSRFGAFQQWSDAKQITICVGFPLETPSRPQIGMIWFRPFEPRSAYAKQHLHADELPWFVQGDTQYLLNDRSHMIAPAICYESLQPNHAESAAALGADVYLVSVAKPAGALAKGMRHYPAVARRHEMFVIMANAVGQCDDFVGVGGSAAWNKRGELLAQMNADSEGIIVMDTVRGEAAVHTMLATGHG